MSGVPTFSFMVFSLKCRVCCILFFNAGIKSSYIFQNDKRLDIFFFLNISRKTGKKIEENEINCTNFKLKCI